MRWAVFFFLFPLSALAESHLSADVAFLGEVHDNPVHHETQAQLTAEIAPTALVFEMLTPAQVAAAKGVSLADSAALEAAFEWSTSGWPDFAMYAPIFAAAPGSRLYGAGVPRGQMRRLMEEDVTAVFGADARLFGLDQPLPADQQDTREAMQQTAHCNAMPAEMLPMMVSIQRLRDAALARAAFQAFEQTGGPVVVITGNGHARKDWGAPFLLTLAAPDLAVWALGQGEAQFGAPEGGFDQTAIGPDIDRPDPCDAFK